MIKKNYIKIYFLLILIFIAIGVILYLYKMPNSLQIQQSNPRDNVSTVNFQYDEIIKSKIGVNGGILQNSEKSIIVSIPPLKKETELTLSFKKSNYAVRSGVGSPITINILPDINILDSPIPISIKVKYDSQYNLPVAYLIDKKNNLHSVDIGKIDKVNHYFTMYTFHGGNYSWIYVN